MSQGAIGQPERLAGCQPGSPDWDPVRPEGAANRKRELVILIKSTVIQNENSMPGPGREPGKARPGISIRARSSGRPQGAEGYRIWNTSASTNFPFGITPDTAYTFIAASHQEA